MAHKLILKFMYSIFKKTVRFERKQKTILNKYILYVAKRLHKI